MNNLAHKLDAAARPLETEAIAIVDLGGQYCHMIGRRLRDFGVRADLFPNTVKAMDLRSYRGVILSGGPQSVNDPDAPTIDDRILDLGLPILGICYGHQLLAKKLGCNVKSLGHGEYGKATLSVNNSVDLFIETPKSQTVWMSHGDSVEDLIPGMQVLARTQTCPIAAFAHVERNIYGVQFHPEVAHTQFGGALLKNFSRRICRVTETETIRDRVDRLLDEIRVQVGDRKVLFFVSGGVDSTVAFSLCAKALPRSQVFGIYVDTGFMRKNETAELESILRKAGLADRLAIRDESKRFWDTFASISHEDITSEEGAELKRREIGRLFVDIQKEAMLEYGIDHDHWLLGQGTIYPDTIESGGHGNHTAVIKTHHNRCEEIRELIARGKVIEPLAEFYKDEVREVGAELGLHTDLVERWPFPGPGLAIRTLCSEENKNAAEEIDLPSEFSSFEAAGFPIRSVGVQGDFRTYRNLLVVKGPLRYPALSNLSTFMCNRGRRFNRVIALVTGKIGLYNGSIVRSDLKKDRVDLLRDADHIVKEIMHEENLMDRVWQFPIILIPLSFAGGESIVLRPVNSEDGMTANFGRLPVKVLRRMGDAIAALPGIDAVFLDVTDKPPATIEWE